MTRYALINADNEILRERDFDVHPSENPAKIGKGGGLTEGKGWRWLPVEEVRPTINRATERFGSSTDRVANGKLIRTFPKIDKTAEEISNELEARVTQAEPDVVMMKLQELDARVAALEGKAAPTLREFIDDLKEKIGARSA